MEQSPENDGEPWYHKEGYYRKEWNSQMKDLLLEKTSLFFYFFDIASSWDRCYFIKENIIRSLDTCYQFILVHLDDSSSPFVCITWPKNQQKIRCRCLHNHVWTGGHLLHPPGRTKIRNNVIPFLNVRKAGQTESAARAIRSCRNRVLPYDRVPASKIVRFV